jgi:hypothetical protein
MRWSVAASSRSTSALGGRAYAAALACAVSGCSVGAGTGEVTGTAELAGCFPEGAYVLAPNAFFAQATEQLLTMRIQRGSEIENESDGLAVSVRDSAEIAESWLGRDIPLRVVPRVTSWYDAGSTDDAGTGPSDAGASDASASDADAAVEAPSAGDAPIVDVTAYFNETCPPGRTKSPMVLQAVSGTIRFDAIYAPEKSREKVRILGTITGARFARNADDSSYAELDGTFDFLYVRGRPAQRFP